jgi:hypothetical protein
MFTAHTVTVDAIRASQTGSLRGYSATSDTDATYAVIGPVPGDADRVYVRGHRHGNLALVTRTGRADVRGRGRQVRVRIAFARDTGDVAGTLAFDAGEIGGVAPRVLFG